jgi:DNA-binding NarL/FixJ family response regulator
MRVFIADDSEIIMERLITMLSELKNIEIIGHARNTHDAMHFIQKMKPDAVILDIQMPGGNGINVLKKIKRYNSPPVVIMLTNYSQYRKKCLSAGADFFFDKSYEFDRVTQIIQDIDQKSRYMNTIMNLTTRKVSKNKLLNENENIT